MKLADISSRYDVDTVPLLLRPFHSGLSLFGGALLFAYARFVYATSGIEIVDRDNLDEQSNYIYCYWHCFSPLHFCAFPRVRGRHAWMQHPGWLAKHVHVVVRLFGVGKIVYGSTGHGGRQAADTIIEYLRGGFSTLVLPDAPRGPAFELKDGVLHMSRESGVPIAPIRFCVSSFVSLTGWDRKRFPLPFGSIRVEYGTPIKVDSDNLDLARVRLRDELGCPE